MRYAICVLLLASSAGLMAQSQVAEPRFEVASVKPSPPSTATNCRPPTCYTGYYQTLPGRLRAVKMSLLALVALAYEMPSTNRVVGPGWAESEFFDVNATHDPASASPAALRAMLQHLLRERFALRVHREQKSIAVYVLKKARDDGRLGPQLVSITDCNDRPIFLPTGYRSCGTMGVPAATSRIGRGTWANLALYRQFAPAVERPVIDETGLSGWFALRLDWSDELPSTSSETVTAADPNRPPLFTALRDQLGLKLEAEERPLEVLVIDGVERPTPD